MPVGFLEDGEGIEKIEDKGVQEVDEGLEVNCNQEPFPLKKKKDLLDAAKSGIERASEVTL